ncbi:uncharacterized protein L201_008058 [Kwoniella dendrophila CBS 6074]|uniref:CWH43-like N-terminal domain-containing protein n=1 Tax=Kwoniella dendrophila CBS 6074 TaxID=1295534 RepID=A0AAX4K7N6_9TREE
MVQEDSRKKEQSNSVEVNRGSNVRANINKVRAYCFSGLYIYLPILAILVWFFGLLILLILWIVKGKPRYQSTQASIAFISDIGAANRALFLSICIVVIILYFSTVCFIRALRHQGRLPETVQLKEKIFSWLAIFFCAVGCIGLFVLAKWNCWDYPKVHWYGTFIFIIGISFSAICQTAEVWCLKKEHPHRKHLKRNGIIKLIIVICSVILASTFGGFYSYCKGKNFSDEGHTPLQCEHTTSTAAILEWTIAFSLNLYFITLIIDLWPSRKNSPSHLKNNVDSSTDIITTPKEQSEKVDDVKIQTVAV